MSSTSTSTSIHHPTSLIAIRTPHYTISSSRRPTSMVWKSNCFIVVIKVFTRVKIILCLVAKAINYFNVCHGCIIHAIHAVPIWRSMLTRMITNTRIWCIGVPSTKLLAIFYIGATLFPGRGGITGKLLNFMDVSIIRTSMIRGWWMVCKWWLVCLQGPFLIAGS